MPSNLIGNGEISRSLHTSLGFVNGQKHPFGCFFVLSQLIIQSLLAACTSATGADFFEGELAHRENKSLNCINRRCTLCGAVIVVQRVAAARKVFPLHYSIRLLPVVGQPFALSDDKIGKVRLEG